MRGVRVVATWAAALIGALVLLIMFAGGAPGQAFSPENRLALDLQLLQSPSSRLSHLPDGVRIEGVRADGSALVLQSFAPFPAAAYRYFRLQIDDVGTEQKALLLLRSGGQSASIPIPGGLRGEVVLDLASAAQWQGEVDVVGVLIAPLDLLAAAHAPVRTPLLRKAVLESPSRRGAIDALLTSWVAYRPWTGRSNNTAGFEYSKIAGPSQAAFLISLLAWIALVIWAARTRHLRLYVTRAVAVALAVLMCGQVVQLVMRTQVAATAALSVPDGSNWPLSASPPLAHDTLNLQQYFSASPPSRLVVWSNVGFAAQYTVWLLRRYNVAYWPPWFAIPVELPAGEQPMHVLVVGREGWRFDRAGGKLVIGEQSMPAVPVWTGAEMQLFRLGPEGAQ